MTRIGSDDNQKRTKNLFLSRAYKKMMNMVRKYKAVTEHLSCDLNGEAVILNIKNGKYYGVNAVGASIWEAIQNPVSFNDIESVILQEFEVDGAACREDIELFLKNMSEENLVEILDEKSS